MDNFDSTETDFNKPGSKDITKLPFTGDFNLDTLILNNLNDRDLSSVCQTNKLARYICTNDIYWMNRTLYYYGRYLGSADIIRERYLGPLSWEQYYKYTLTVRRLDFEKKRDQPVLDSDKLIVSLLPVFDDITHKYKDNNFALKLIPGYNPEGFRLKIDEIKEMIQRVMKIVSMIAHLDIHEKIDFNGIIIGKKESLRLAGYVSSQIGALKGLYRESMKRRIHDKRYYGRDTRTLPYAYVRMVRNIRRRFSNMVRSVYRGVTFSQEAINDIYGDLDNTYAESLKLLQ